MTAAVVGFGAAGVLGWRGFEDRGTIGWADTLAGCCRPLATSSWLQATARIPVMA